jgi:signal transduction histidine kinase
MNISIALWALGFAMGITAPNKALGFFWVRILNIGAICIPLFYLHFVFAFLRIDIKKKPLLLLAYIITSFMLVFSFTSFFHTDVEPKLSFRYYSVPGSLYFLYILMLFAYINYGLFKLFKAYRTATGAFRNQIKYFIYASIIAFTGGSTTFLLVFDINVYPFGQLFFPLNALVMAYAIVKHRLMDIDFVIRKSVTYAYASFLLLFPLFAVIIAYQILVFKSVIPSLSVLALSTIIIAAYLFPKVRFQAEKTVEQYVFKDKYDYKKTLSDLSRATVSILNINDLCHNIVNTTTEAMDVDRASIFILDEEKDAYNLCDAKGINEATVSTSYKKDDAFFKRIEQRGDILIREELERFDDNPDAQTTAQMMQKMGAEISIPLIAKNRLIGLLNLGIKGSKKMYTHEDLELLDTLANNATIAIENSQLYEAQKKAKKYMLRADRLASLGTLSAGLAHEIRNPLVAIKTFTQLLPDRFDDEEFRNSFLNVTTGEIDRISSLITELLDFARPADPFFQQQNINDVVEKMFTLIQNQAKKKELSIEKYLAENLPNTTIDIEQIKQVLLNLLLNAIQATPEKGKISIRTRKFAKVNGGPEYVQVEIRDTGEGIAEEDLDKIFTPFFTTKSKGSGLGLAISNQIIQEHEGTIDVQSTLQQGTTFTINLPVNPLIFKKNQNNDRQAH